MDQGCHPGGLAQKRQMKPHLGPKNGNAGSMVSTLTLARRRHGFMWLRVWGLESGVVDVGSTVQGFGFVGVRNF